MVIPARTRPVQGAALALAAVLVIVAAVGAFNAMRAAFEPRTLYPASVPSIDSLCYAQLQPSLDGDVSPLFCQDGSINTNAWSLLAVDDPEVMRLGRKATPADVMGAIGYDLRQKMSGPRECGAAMLSAAYYGWNFHINPVSGLTLDCPILK